MPQIVEWSGQIETIGKYGKVLIVKLDHSIFGKETCVLDTRQIIGWLAFKSRHGKEIHEGLKLKGTAKNGIDSLLALTVEI